MTLTEEERKQRKRESDKKWREKNKELKNQIQKKYYQKNKEKFKQYREKSKEYQKNYYKENSYDKNPKKYLKSCWKSAGVKFTDEEFESIWKEYTTQTHCEFCYTELNNNDYQTKKCLDHDHETGQFRFILCFVCNITRQSD